MSKPVITRRHTEITYEYGNLNQTLGRFSNRDKFKMLITYDGKEVYRIMKIPCMEFTYEGRLIGMIQYYKHTKALSSLDHTWIPGNLTGEEQSFVNSWNTIFEPLGWIIDDLGWALSSW